MTVMKIMLKRTWLWILKHKTLSIVVGIIGFLGSIASIFSWYKIEPPDIVTYIKNYSTTFTLNFAELLLVAAILLLFVALLTDYSIKLIFKTVEKQKLEKAKTKVSCLIKRWQELANKFTARETKPEPRSNLPKDFQRLGSEAAQSLRIIEHHRRLQAEYKDFLLDCKELKDYSDNQIANLASEYPKIDSFAKILKGIVISNQQLDISKEALADTKDGLRRVVGTLENIYKTLE